MFSGLLGSLLACGPQSAGDGSNGAEDGTDEGCMVGAEGCPCTSGGACDAGLMCLSGICVDADGDGGPGDASVSQSGGTVDSDDSGGTDSASSGGSSDGADGTDGGTSGGGSGDCEDADEWAKLRHIWIANTAAGTVSKIDTEAAVELARYATTPASGAQPSRTAVNLHGDVAVASRGSTANGPGHITKIAGHMEDCVDRSGNGGIETSQSSGDVLPWMQDECILWSHEVPSDIFQHGPRPLGWERGPDGDCGSPDVNLWIGWYEFNANRGRFELLNGQTGAILEEASADWSGLDYGPYGGAMDGAGNFWAIGWQRGPLVRVRGDTLQVDRFEFPMPPSGMQWSYGMAIDQWGNPWIASSGAVATFDAGMEQWSWVNIDHLSVRGVAADREDRIWFAIDGAGGAGLGGCGLSVVDAVTKTVLTPQVAVPGCITPVGVAIDAEGYVWVVDEGANEAFKVDADTYDTVATVTGLSSPYTYSDMTGANLFLVAAPPG